MQRSLLLNNTRAIARVLFLKIPKSTFLVYKKRLKYCRHKRKEGDIKLVIGAVADNLTSKDNSKVKYTGKNKDKFAKPSMNDIWSSER